MKSPSAKIFNKNFIILCVISIISTFSSLSLNTVLSLYAQQELGATLSLAGTLVGICSVASLVMLPLSGTLSNRVDKRLLTLLSTVATLIGMLGFAFTDVIGILMVFRFITGLGYGIACTTSMVMVTEALPAEKVVVGVGLYGLVGVVIQSVGPALALAVSGRFGFKVLFLMGAFLCVVQMGVTLLLPKYKVTLQAGRKFSFKEIIAPEAILTATIGFLFAFNNGVQTTFIASYAADSGLGSAGLYFAIQAVFTALARLFFTKITNRHTVAFATTIAGVFLTLFSIVLGFGDTLAHFYIASACFGLGYGTLLPVTQSVSILRVPEERKASGSSTYFFGIQIAFAISGTIGGLIADKFGYSVMFLSLVVPSVIAILIGVLRGRFPVSPAAYDAYIKRKHDIASERVI